MKNKVVFAALLFATFVSCTKEQKYPEITGTVQQSGGCLPDTWLVYIDSGNADQYSFLCKSSTPTSGLNCSNSVYIVDMPSALQQLGRRIKFSRWKDNDGFCLSSSFAPHLLEVSDIAAD